MDVLAAAEEGDAAVVADLLAAGADPNAADAEGTTALHVASRLGHTHIVSALLAAGASPGLPNLGGLLPIHVAAEAGQPAVTSLLLEAAPETARAVGMGGLTPLFLAVLEVHEELVRLLLEAAPAAALIRTQRGMFPLYTACHMGHAAIARQLLEAAPEAATMLAGDAICQASPLHAAAQCGHLGIVQLILEVVPSAAAVMSSNGLLALHLAAASHHPCSAAIVQALLAAAPATAAVPIRQPGAALPTTTALHLAAIKANAAAAALLVQAAPHVCLMRFSAHNMLPLEAVFLMADAELRGQDAPGAPSPLEPLSVYLDTARPMLAAMPPELSLPVLVRRSDVALPLFPELARHWPLTAAQWAQVPNPCPGLGRALPATLQRSVAEAALLVARLPPADAARLRTFALALHRSQRQLGLFLPTELAARILSLFDA